MVCSVCLLTSVCLYCVGGVFPLTGFDAEPPAAAWTPTQIELLAAVCIQAAYRGRFCRCNTHAHIVSRLRMWAASRTEAQLLRFKHSMDSGNLDMSGHNAEREYARLQQLAQLEAARLTRWQQQCDERAAETSARLNLLRRCWEEGAQQEQRRYLAEKSATIEAMAVRRQKVGAAEVEAVVREGKQKLLEQERAAEKRRACIRAQLAELRASSSVQEVKRIMLEEEHRAGIRRCWGRSDNNGGTAAESTHSPKHEHKHKHKHKHKYSNQMQFLLACTIRLQAKFRGDYVRRRNPDVISHMRLWRSAHAEMQEVRLKHYQSAARSAAQAEAEELARIKRNIEASLSFSSH
jgi:hypothetical protein